MKSMEEEQIKILHVLVGEYLAGGLANEEILKCLVEEQKLEEEDAYEILRGVYDSWTSVREGLSLQSEDDRNWHQHLRIRLLRSALSNESVPSQNLALRVLDSLANLQGITTVIAQPVPLSIELVEKKEEVKEDDTG